MEMTKEGGVSVISTLRQLIRGSTSRITRLKPVFLFWAIALGVVMPIVSALLYPTYHVMMPQPVYELTRLVEFPFVTLELSFIFWVMGKGFSFRRCFLNFPCDIRIAIFVLLVVIFSGVFFVSKNTAYSLLHSVLWIIHLVFALSLLFEFSRARPGGHDGDGFLGWHAIGLAVLGIFTAWRFTNPPPVDSLPFGEILWRGAIPGFIDVRHLGSWAGALAAGFAIRILFGMPDARLWWARLCYFLAAAMTIWSGTRAAVLAIIFVTFVFLMCLRRLPAWKKTGWAALASVLACGAAYILVWDRPPFWLITFSELASAEELTKTRAIMWGRTVQLWLQSPWLGLGTGSIFWEYGPDMTPTQPHNVALQFLVSWGVIGALSGLWILLRGLRVIHQKGISNPKLFGLLGVFHALVFQSLFEGMLHYPRFITEVIVLGLLIYCYDDDQKSDFEIDPCKNPKEAAY